MSLGNMTLIAVNGYGNHLFNVSGEMDYDYPGIGAVKLWILRDMYYNRGIAWYEQSTGILLNGTFVWSRGSYVLTLISTNFFSHYQTEEKEFPWFNFSLILAFVSIMTIVIINRVHHGSKRNPDI